MKFYGFSDSGLGAFNFYADLGFDTSEILVYAGGRSDTTRMVNSKSDLLGNSKEIITQRIRDLMINLMDAKKQNSMICARGKHLRHEFDLFKSLQTETWAVECKNCQDEHSYIKNEIGKSGMTLEFIELQNLYDNQKNKKFVYLIIIDGQVYPGLSKKSFGIRFEDEVKAAYGKDKKRFYDLSVAIRNKLGFDPNNLPPMSEIIRKAKEEIDLVLWQVCETDIEMRNAERFWIGATKSQFKGYGYSITAGGEGGGQTTRIIPKELIVEALEHSLEDSYKSTMSRIITYINNRKDSFLIDYKDKYKDMSIDYPINEHVVTNSLKEFHQEKTLETLKAEYKKDTLLDLFKHGEDILTIADIFGINEETAIKWIKESISNSWIKETDILIPRAIREILTKGELNSYSLSRGLKTINKRNAIDRYSNYMLQNSDKINEYYEEILEDLYMNGKDPKDIIKNLKNVENSYLNNDDIIEFLSDISGVQWNSKYLTN